MQTKSIDRSTLIGNLNSIKFTVHYRTLNLMLCISLTSILNQTDCSHLTSFFGKMVGNLCSPEVDLRTGSLITRDFFLSRHKIHFKVDLYIAFYIFCLFFRVFEDNPHQTSGIDIQSMQTFKRWIKSPWSVKCLVKAPPLRNCWFVSFFLYKKL